MKQIYQRPHIKILQSRLAEPPKSIIFVAGPRQIGKSTMVHQALKGFSNTFESADLSIAQNKDLYDPYSYIEGNQNVQEDFVAGAKPTVEWIIRHWTQARTQARRLPEGQYHVLALDEIQKIPRWSEVIKGLWDADRAEGVPLHVVLLGSAPLFLQKGLSESLAGRFEPIYMTHWSYTEMQEAFDFSFDEFVYFGGYPGGADKIRNESRWRTYVLKSLIEPNINHDILKMTRVDKPALLKNLFELGCGFYSGQIISLTKLLGPLDARHTETLAHYLDLLSQAGLLTGITKYAGQEHRKRASPPKLNAHNTALISALNEYSFFDAKNDRSYWGRLIESAIGAHLINNKSSDCRLHYWRESPSEVDFILIKGQKILAIEVKSGARFSAPKGLEVFMQKFEKSKSLLIGTGGIALHEFLAQPVDSWLE